MKYTILMSCGHEDEINILGKSSEKERKIEYFKSCGLCKKCYKKKMEEETASIPLTFNGTILPDINTKDGSILIYIWFSGNSKPYKDSIKNLGYRWGERKAASDYFSISRPPLCWGKIIEVEDLEKEIEKAESIGAINSILNDGLHERINYEIALQKRKKWMEEKSKE